MALAGKCLFAATTAYGAAWESNPPSAGLRRLTGFEDETSISVDVRDVQPDRFGSGVVRDRVRDCQPGVGSVEAA
jgi:hypothetical protein